MLRFHDIVQFTRHATYCVDVSWHYLPSHYYTSVTEYGLNVYPDFQRNYVWNEEQKIRYVEYILQGGASGKDLYFNCPSWNSVLETGNYVLVDGRQRLDAVLGFLSNEFPIFGGNYRRDYEDSPHILRASFKWHINDLKTNDEVLRWYVDLNSGGTIHSEDEIGRVRSLIGQPPIQPSREEVLQFANLERAPIVAVREALRAEERKRQEQRAAAAAAPPMATKKRSKQNRRGV